MRKNLYAGERFLLEEDTGFWQVVSGRVEVYATTQNGSDIAFHQCYLVEKQAGEAVFPALDEFQEVRMQIYALEDCELMFCRWQEAEREYLRGQMQAWFSSLVQISWLRLLADSLPSRCRGNTASSCWVCLVSRCWSCSAFSASWSVRSSETLRCPRLSSPLCRRSESIVRSSATHHCCH